MKTLELNQMEKISGSGHCTAATILSPIQHLSPFLGALFVYETTMCALFGDEYTF